MAARIARFNIDFTATSAALRQTFNRVGAEAQGLRAKLAKTFRGLNIAALIGGGAGVAGLTAALKQSFSSLDELAKLSDRLGADPRGLRSLQLAAELGGASLRELETGLVTYQRRIDEADTGTKSAADAFARLSINVADLRQLGIERQIQLLAERLSAVRDPAEKTRLAFDLLGRSGSKLLLTLSPQAIAAATAEVQKLGGALTRQNLARIEAANDAFTKMRASVSALVDEVAIQLAPGFSELADAIRDMVPQMKSLLQTTNEFIIGVRELTAETVKMRDVPFGAFITGKIPAGMKERIPTPGGAALRDAVARALALAQESQERSPLMETLLGMSFRAMASNLRGAFARTPTTVGADAGLTGPAGGAFLSRGTSAAFSASMRGISDARRTAQNTGKTVTVLNAIKQAILKGAPRVLIDAPQRGQ